MAVKRIHKIKISRGMDLTDAVEAAKHLGCDITPPADNNPHWRLRCKDVHGNRVLSLSSGRRDTPWVAAQWLKAVLDRRVAEQVEANKRAEELKKTYQDVTTDSGMNDASETAGVESDDIKRPDTPEECLARARDIALTLRIEEDAYAGRLTQIEQLTEQIDNIRASAAINEQKIKELKSQHANAVAAISRAMELEVESLAALSDVPA